MKKILLLILGIVLLTSFTFAYECKAQTSQWNVPCVVVTPVLNCISIFNSNVTNVENNSINTYYNTSPVGDGTYLFTFNYSDIGTYSIVNCDGSSGTIDVIKGTEENEPEFNLWFLFLIIFFLLLIFGTYFENYFLLFLSGCIILVMGVFVFSNNSFSLYNATDYWFVYPLGWIFTGLGILLTVVSGLEIMREAMGEKE
jgi:hypothetical protein